MNVTDTINMFADFDGCLISTTGVVLITFTATKIRRVKSVTQLVTNL